MVRVVTRPPVVLPLGKMSRLDSLMLVLMLNLVESVRLSWLLLLALLDHTGGTGELV